MSYSWFVPANGGNDFWTTAGDLADWNGYGNMQTAIAFEVTDDGYELAGYYYWFNSATTDFVPGGFALWSSLGSGTGTVVPGSVISSVPTPTVTGWQYVALDSPVTLTASTPYKIEFAAYGGFFWHNDYTPFESGGGIVNDPLTVYSDAGGSNPIPIGGEHQGTFSTATNVPGTVYPDTAYASGAPAIDVLITPVVTGPVMVLTTTLPNAELETSYIPKLTVSGGTSPYSWAVTTGTLPTGLSLASNGHFSGIPTALGTSDFTVEVTDAASGTDSKSLSIKVANPSYIAVYDGFTGGDGSLGSNWTPITTSVGLKVSSGVVENSVGGGVNGGDYWSGRNFTPDQFSQMTLSTVPTSGDWMGPAVRCNSDGSSTYVVIVNPAANALALYKRIGSSFSGALVGYGVSTFHTGDIIKLSVIGSVLTASYNGVDVITYTDTSITSGQPGIMVFGNSAQADNWSGGNGNGVVQVFAPSTSGGVDTYSTYSQINNTGAAGNQNMRVLVPTDPNPGYTHAFLWLLPVEPGQGTGFGDSIATIEALGAHNDYNLTCIQPGFPVDPWYGNNVDDPATQQETFMLDLVTWAEEMLAISGTEKHYLIGFSKSGFGGQVLFMRNQPTFAGVASWDAATDYQTLAQYDGGDVFGEQSQLDAYSLYDPNLATWKADGDTATVNRIWLGAGINLIAATSDYSDRLTADGIQHSYSYVLADSHQWAPTPGWVGPAISEMIGPPDIALARLLMCSGIL